MKQRKYNYAQMRSILEQYKQGRSVTDMCQEYGMARSTFYDWMREEKAKSDVPEQKLDKATVREYSSLKKERSFLWQELENVKGQLRLFKDTLHRYDSQYIIANKMVRRLMKDYAMSKKQACTFVGLDLEFCTYKPYREEPDDDVVFSQIKWFVEHGVCNGINDCYKVLKKLHPDWTYNAIRKVHKERYTKLHRKRDDVQGRIGNQRMKLEEKKRVRLLQKQDAALKSRVENSSGKWLVAYCQAEVLKKKYREQSHIYVMLVMDAVTNSPVSVQVELDFDCSVVLESINNLHGRWSKNAQNLQSVTFPDEALFKSDTITEWAKQNKIKIGYFKGKSAAVFKNLQAEIHKRILFADGLLSQDKINLLAELWEEGIVRPDAG